MKDEALKLALEFIVDMDLGDGIETLEGVDKLVDDLMVEDGDGDINENFDKGFNAGYLRSLVELIKGAL